jgi:hypothetical protein
VFLLRQGPGGDAGWGHRGERSRRRRGHRRDAQDWRRLRGAERRRDAFFAGGGSAGRPGGNTKAISSRARVACNSIARSATVASSVWRRSAAAGRRGRPAGRAARRSRPAWRIWVRHWWNRGTRICKRAHASWTRQRPAKVSNTTCRRSLAVIEPLRRSTYAGPAG